MKVDLEELRKIQKYLNKLETTPLEDIKWHLNGLEVEVLQSDIDEWIYTGLSNKYFAFNYLISE